MIYYKCSETHKKHIKYFQFLGEVGNLGGPVQKNILLIFKNKIIYHKCSEMQNKHIK